MNGRDGSAGIGDLESVGGAGAVVRPGACKPWSGVRTGEDAGAGPITQAGRGSNPRAARGNRGQTKTPSGKPEGVEFSGFSMRPAERWSARAGAPAGGTATPDRAQPGSGAGAGRSGTSHRTRALRPRPGRPPS